MQSDLYAFDGLVFRCLRPTVKKSRGKLYPSLDIRRFDVNKTLKLASMHGLCAVWCYEYKKKTYVIEMKPGHAFRTTLTCREGLPLTEEVIRGILGKWRATPLPHRNYYIPE